MEKTQIELKQWTYIQERDRNVSPNKCHHCLDVWTCCLHVSHIKFLKKVVMCQCPCSQLAKKQNGHSSFSVSATHKHKVISSTSLNTFTKLYLRLASITANPRPTENTHTSSLHTCYFIKFIHGLSTLTFDIHHTIHQAFKPAFHPVITMTFRKIVDE